MLQEKALHQWECVLELRSDRSVASGSPQALRDAVRQGADLRVFTMFAHNEHVDPNSAHSDLIHEVIDFRVTYLLNDCWVAGINNLRQPISLPEGFGPRPSMSFFLYNEDAQQAIARLYLDAPPVNPDGKLGPSPPNDHSDMPKYHELDSWDAGTNAPSSNFIYDFHVFRYCVRRQWQEVFSHAADGTPLNGSVQALGKAFTDGREVKVAIRGLCDDLAEDSDSVVDHEVFSHTGSCYYYTGANVFMAAAHPLVRVRPIIPLCYKSRAWDVGWVMPRSDGHLARLLYDPYTLQYSRSETRCAMRWFVQQ